MFCLGYRLIFLKFQAIQAIQAIDPDRHRPPPAKSHDGFKTTTKTVMSEKNDDELESPWVDGD